MGFKVRISRNILHFAASHFITFGGKCEYLHGHNYGVTVELEGPLTDDGYVFDFVALKKTGRAICETLDHRFLLASRNPHLQIRQHDACWEIDFQGSHYTFPAKDVKCLPVDNITAERLAEYIWGLLAQELRRAGAAPGSSLTVGVAEAEGQEAFFNETLTG